MSWHAEEWCALKHVNQYGLGHPRWLWGRANYFHQCPRRSMFLSHLRSVVVSSYSKFTMVKACRCEYATGSFETKVGIIFKDELPFSNSPSFISSMKTVRNWSSLDFGTAKAVLNCARRLLSASSCWGSKAELCLVAKCFCEPRRPCIHLYAPNETAPASAASPNANAMRGSRFFLSLYVVTNQ